MRRKGVSQGDVARRAGVSPTAVSIVLNGKEGVHRIAPETVQRIQEAIAELRYRPNAVAQSLAHGRTNTIGVVLGQADMTYLSNPYYGPALQGIIGTAFHQRRFVLLYHGGELGAADLEAPSFTDGRCDGLILTPPFSAPRFTEQLLEIDMPFVTLGDTHLDPRIPGADIDNETVGETAASYLLDHGHWRILGIGVRGYSESALRRLIGGRRIVESRGGVFEEVVLPTKADDGLHAVLRRYLEEGNVVRRPTALFCLTDDVALRAIRLLKEMGRAVPRDVSVIGFDDDPLSAEAGLTTIRQDSRRVGEEATRLLLRLIESGYPQMPFAEPTHVFLPTELVERSSVAAPSPASAL